MLQLDYGDKRPIYEQIKEKTKELILNGIIKEHERIPSVRELACSTAINPNTIQKAYKELENEGFIYSQRAKGYFVAPVDLSDKSGHTDSVMEEFAKHISELSYLGVPKEILISIIDDIYKGGNV